MWRDQYLDEISIQLVYYCRPSKFIFLYGFCKNFRTNFCFIDWFFLSVTTIGDIKYLSEQFVSFVMCFLSSIFWSSELTLDCRLKIYVSFFWCLGWKCFRNFDLATCLVEKTYDWLRPSATTVEVEVGMR